jgi:SAM-dependent methyltransferase
MLPAGIFRCPDCGAPLAALGPCGSCGFSVSEAAGIPLLVRDRAAIDRTIEAAKLADRAAWYEAPQDAQWTGPYRHHLRKRRAYVDGVIARFAAGAPEQRRALDIGCGDGTHLPWLRTHAGEVFASDYNITRLMRARRFEEARCVFMADVTNYPTNDDLFDVIFFNHVLEHIADDLTALREVRRILKPGGLLILGVPNEAEWFWQLAYRLEPRFRRTSDHVQFYTAESIEAKCRDAGFMLRETKHIGYGPPHWTLDALVRRFKTVDDALEAIGTRLFPRQASSLYLALGKAQS